MPRKMLSNIMTLGRRWLQLSASVHINQGQSAKQKHRGILVPGGFGQRGTEGMVLAAKRARENKIPFLGICLGFQIAVVEYASNVCNLQGDHPLDDFSVSPSNGDFRCNLNRVGGDYRTSCHHLHARNLQNAYGRYYAPWLATDCLPAWLRRLVDRPEAVWR